MVARMMIIANMATVAVDAEHPPREVLAASHCGPTYGSPKT
jgi:hypothetical protein